MIYQCSGCGNEFDGELHTEQCPVCKADKSHFVQQPFNVLSEMESHSMSEDSVLED